jgi:DNA-binding response OmpR family regulator
MTGQDRTYPMVLVVTADGDQSARWQSNSVVPHHLDVVRARDSEGARDLHDKHRENLVLVVLSAAPDTAELIEALRGEGYSGPILVVTDDPEERDSLKAAGATNTSGARTSGASIRRLLDKK